MSPAYYPMKIFWSIFLLAASPKDVPYSPFYSVAINFKGGKY